ncbi:hypothetical protein ACU5DF_23835 [Aliivibrio wodanis]|uniref:hypothetical protein n=1 Tax=Aliivibrio wodanis TaxID=80852 RepID=UPI00406D4946
MSIYVTIRGINYHLDSDHPLGNTIHDGNGLIVHQNDALVDGRELMDEFVEMLCNQLAEYFTSFEPEDFLEGDFRTW